MAILSPSFGVAVGVVSLPFLVLLWRRPLLRRIAARNARSRPREAALVVAGALLGTAILTGSLVVSDTLRASLQFAALNRLGPVDEIIETHDQTAWTAASQSLTRHVPNVAGALPIAMLNTPSATAGSGHRRAAPHATMIELGHSSTPAVWRGRYGYNAPAPAQGHTVLGARLAKTLHARAGSKLVAYVYGQPVDLIVDRVIPQRGLGAFTWGLFVQEPENLFVAPGTIAPLVAAAEDKAASDFSPASWLVGISNKGTLRSGLAHADAAMEGITRRLTGINATVHPAKREALISAVASGKQVTIYYAAMGMFGALAGLLLLINVLTMMTEERTTELGMMRAVGLGRAGLVGAFALEGWLYSLVAAVLGAFAGIGLGRALVNLMVRIGTFGTSGFRLVFNVRPASLTLGMTLGLVVSVCTVLLTSVRISRLDVIRAIRDLPDVDRRPRRRVARLGAVVALAGAAGTVAGIAQGNAFGLLAGPAVGFSGLGLVADRYMSRRKVVTWVTMATLAWDLGLPFTGHQPPTADLVPIVVQGVVLTIAAVLLVCQQQDRLARALRRLGLGRRLSARVGLAHPVGRPSRTALTLAPFTLVVFTITAITILTAMLTTGIALQGRRGAGGYQVIVTSTATNPISFDELAKRPDVEAIAPTARVPATYVVKNGGDRHVWFLTAFDRSLLRERPPTLIQRGRYKTDAAAWRAVERNPDLIITTVGFLQNTPGQPAEYVGLMKVGRPITIIDPDTDQAHVVRVAALVGGDMAGDGVWYGREGARQLFGGRLVTNRALVRVKGSPTRFADRVGSAYVANGGEADTFPHLARTLFDFILGITALFRAYLGLGLIVGVAGIGVVMVRAVRERRHEIGVLRAVGFEAGHIARSFFIEAGFLAVEAVVIGVSLALVTTYSIAHSRTTSLLLGGSTPWRVPQLQLAILVGLIVVAALLAAGNPARTAARIPPSEALRLVD